jgi:hypothetical protein
LENQEWKQFKSEIKKHLLILPQSSKKDMHLEVSKATHGALKRHDATHVKPASHHTAEDENTRNKAKTESAIHSGFQSTYLEHRTNR